MNDDGSDRSDAIRSVVILGAAGYLGSALCQFFHALPGHRVVAVSRRNPPHSFFERHVMADVFARDWAPQVAADVPVVLINCAFDFKGIESGGKADKFAIFERNIASVAQAPSARLINISSMSAFAGCRTDYGREKLLIESMFARLGGISIRPGLIASWRRPGAAFLNLINIAIGSRLVPILTARGSGFHFCDLEAVVLGIYALTRMKLGKPHTLSFCYRDRIQLRDVLRLIEERNHASSLKIPVPWRIAYLMLLAKEALIGKSKVRADSVLDFAYPNPRPQGRRAFARLVAHWRSELEKSLHAKPATDTFCFLEGPSRSSAPRSCRIAQRATPHVMSALGRLADP
jgi:nucleoside-diphosphate-sugar epimerase